MFINVIIIVISCFCFLILLRILSIKLALVDNPDHRKTHRHPVPLVGGIAIYCSILVMHLISAERIPHFNAYLVSGGLLLVVGVLDDRFQLPVLPRLVVQGIAAVLIMYDGIYLHSLGFLWFNEELTLGSLGYLFTLFAVGAAINIFNMMDGIDGLLAGMCTVSFAGLAVCFSLAGQQSMMVYCLLLIAAIIPFMLCNLGIAFGGRQKVFMGDAGSTLLGFTVIWLVIICSQGQQIALAPANALWLIALPLMDMVCVTSGRIKNNKSAFHPDRTHFHHLLMNYGLSDHKTLSLMVALGIIYCVAGVSLQINHVNQRLSLCMFLCLFVLHYFIRKKLIYTAVKKDRAE